MSVLCIFCAYSRAEEMPTPGAAAALKLYDCSHQLSQLGGMFYDSAFSRNGYVHYSDLAPDPRSPLSAFDAMNIDFNYEFFYILDRATGILYVYTPYFAGKTDLSHDQDGHKIEVIEKYIFHDRYDPNAGSYSGDTPTYRVRIPYKPSETRKKDAPSGQFFAPAQEQPGYFYLIIRKVGATYSSRLEFLEAKFAAEPANPAKPVSPSQGLNGDVEYHSLEFEDRVWSRTAPNNFSKDAIDFLEMHTALRIKVFPPQPSVGDTVPICPGMGCTATYTKEDSEADHKRRETVFNACESALEGTRYHAPPRD